MKWLRDGQGCYWVNGKAASGKSTLMKCLVRQPETQAALHAWAGSSELITRSFFFWNVGRSLQKSQEGIFRAILHSVLEESPFMVRRILPGFYNDLYTWSYNNSKTDPRDFYQLTFVEIGLAFLRLTQDLEFLNTKMCLFIDGVDEYEGDHSELAEFLRKHRQQARKARSVKPANPSLQDRIQGLPEPASARSYRS
jgi:hypothetical protein